MIKLSDYIIQFIERLGVKHVFLISGGGNIHLVDSLGKSKKIQYICNHHEQASAIAAEAYSRVTGNIGVCLVTTGPGGTNAITGVLGAWLDSIPMLIISGQVKRDMIGAGTIARQLGDQEINIVDIVKPITKHRAVVMDPADIRYQLEKAVYIAKSGRKGPVWLDIPLDMQGAMVSENTLRGFADKELKPEYINDTQTISTLVSTVISKIKQAKRPVIYAGNGIRLSGAFEQFLSLVEKLQIPVLLSYAGYDLLPSSHPCNFGRAHAFGQRGANFILQNSDLLLSIGARLDIRTIGFRYTAFARGAYKIMVDIDKKELEKPILSIDLPIQTDAKVFIKEMIKQLTAVKNPPPRGNPLASARGYLVPTQSGLPGCLYGSDNYQEWLEYGRKLNKKYPVVLPEFWQEKTKVNPYCFIETIGKYLSENELIVVSNGIGPLNCSYQALQIKKGQRVILNNGCAQMGYGLPAAIGAAFATSKKKRVICFEGDGSLQLNIHELQVVKHHNLPIKLFIYDNDGYQSIRNTQNNLFGGFHAAVDAASGVSCPDFFKIAKAYGLPAVKINNHKDMERKIKQVLSFEGPCVCVINTVRNLMLTPKLMARKLPDGQFVSPPLEDMLPFLSREELKKNMIIPLWKEE